MPILLRSAAKAALRVAMLAALAAPSSVAWSQAGVSSVFDHFTTAFRLDGAHQFAACESCHVDGMFDGTPLQCSGCHSHGSRVRATAQPAGHMLASQFCESCHRTRAWVPVARVDHLEVFGTCASCHDGGTAATKPTDHVPASNQCDDCHRTVAWLPATFEHAGITSGCAACHNGMVAMGKPVDHIAATNLCEDCHRVVMWSPVARVDHFQVLGVCSGCHNGTTAMGQHAAHIPTTNECDTCHNTTAWRP
jgi:hypothetical protein